MRRCFAVLAKAGGRCTTLRRALQAGLAVYDEAVYPFLVYERLWYCGIGSQVEAEAISPSSTYCSPAVSSPDWPLSNTIFVAVGDETFRMRHFDREVWENYYLQDLIYSGFCQLTMAFSFYDTDVLSEAICQQRQSFRPFIIRYW